MFGGGGVEGFGMGLGDRGGGNPGAKLGTDQLVFYVGLFFPSILLSK